MRQNSQIHLKVSVWLMTNFVSLVANILLHAKLQWKKAGRSDLGIWPHTITYNGNHLFHSAFWLLRRAIREKRYLKGKNGYLPQWRDLKSIQSIHLKLPDVAPKNALLALHDANHHESLASKAARARSRAMHLSCQVSCCRDSYKTRRDLNKTYESDRITSTSDLWTVSRTFQVG